MKFCQYCGRQANDDDNFCQGCGARLVDNVQPIEEASIPEKEVTVEEPVRSGAPHWLLKMLSLLSLLHGIIGLIIPGLFFIGLGTGIACLILDKKGEFRAKTITGVVFSSISALVWIVMELSIFLIR